MIYRSWYIFNVLTFIILISNIIILNSRPMPIIADGKIGFIDSTGQLIIQPQYSSYIEFTNFKYRNKKIKSFNLPKQAYFNEGYASLLKADVLWFIVIAYDNIIINENGHTSCNMGGIKHGQYSDGLIAMVAKNRGLRDDFIYYNYCDNRGYDIISIPFRYAGPFVNGRALVLKDDNFSYIDKTGTFINKSTYSRAESFSEDLAAVMVDDKWGFINRDGEMAISPQFVRAQSFSDGMARVMDGKAFGFIDKNGKLIIDYKFVSANEFSEGYASVSDADGYKGFIDKEGNWTFKDRYLSVGNFKQGLAPVDYNGKFGYVDYKGNFVIQPQYDFAEDFLNGFAKVYYNDKLHYINMKGEVIWTFDL
ncbi:MAG: WG repeat-containing protein [Candidatus Kapaibacterium sp.]|nr:WG repeat-containing protein [Candidatus Kapabacteria bacterium]